MDLSETRPDPPVPSWKVLIVDDEPSVHQVSQLLLSDLQFEGASVELLSAASACEAAELLARTPGIALVLLDVVMETDDAGLALVQHIRDGLGERDLQIVVRTGQPGMAPEHDVVLQHEINGYCLKTDLTAQRLHSIVISALRSYRYARALRTEISQSAAPEGAGPADPARERLAAELGDCDPAQSMLLWAQPEVSLATNGIVGIELVPRWRSSQGLLTAARIGETLGAGAVHRRFTLTLLDQAFSWARAWAEAGEATMRVSIPLPGHALEDGELLAAALERLREAALPPGTLDLLISSESLQVDAPGLREPLRRLRAEGASCTVVDVGARMVSLQRLSRLAPERLKIHRPFVRGVAQDPERMALARAVIALAQTLRIVAIADGVQTDSDVQFFKWEGCELGQGDLLACAAAPGDIAGMLQRNKRNAH